MKILSICTAVLLLSTACGSGENNLADCEKGSASVPCEEGSAEDRARKALDAGDPATAVQILSDLITAEPEVYARYPLLASAQAAVAGFDILNVVRAQFSGGGSVFDLMKNFLPDPATMTTEAYQAALVSMAAAVTTLRSVPESQRVAAADAGESWAKSTSFQLTLYQSGYSVMYLNQFTFSTTNPGEIDVARLETMSDADAAAILANLAAAASVQQGEQGAAVQSAVASAQASIAAQPGTTDRERLIAYTRSRQSS